MKKEIQEYPPLPPTLKIRDTYQEQITKFAFQLTRKTPYELNLLSKQLTYLLISLKNALFISDDTDEINKYLNYFILLHKLILYTRDIFVGKGERDLTYMMIYVWYTQFPILAINVLKLIINNPKGDYTKSIGTWKDIKYFCNYVKDHSDKGMEDPLIVTCIYILNQQLIEDLSILFSTSSNTNNNNVTENKKISFVAKWIPREKSKKFGWLFHKCAIQWSKMMYPEYYYFATTKPTIKFQNKVKMEYRKNISNLNRYLDTPQIKLCENKWSEIKFDKVSEITQRKQFGAFINQDIYGYIRKNSEDRSICRENIISYLFFKENPNHSPPKMEIHSSFQMEDIIKDIEYIQTPEYIERINIYWDKVKSSILQKTENIIPILDLTTANYVNALSISLMLSEISKIQNKILVYDQVPDWVNLSNTSSLLEKIEKIQQIKNSKNPETSNIFSALELLMLSILNTNLPNEDIENLVLCIVSDFSVKIQELHLHIQYFFHKNGYSKSPHIIYWNVSLQNNIYYPCSAFTPRTLMISGTSSSCFHFLNDPLWKEYTPYTYLSNILNTERYSEVDNYFLQLTLDDEQK